MPSAGDDEPAAETGSDVLSPSTRARSLVTSRRVMLSPHHCTASASGKSPVELVARLRKVPVGMNPIAPTVLAAIVGGSVAQIRILNAQIVALESSLARALAVHPKTALLQTLPRVANVSLAALIAEIGPLLERCDKPSTGSLPSAALHP